MVPTVGWSVREPQCQLQHRRVAVRLGSAANLAAAKRLSAHTRDAELLLLADPCPDLWGARQLNSIVATLAEVGHEIVLAFGDPQGAERTMLNAKVVSARRMVTELQRLGMRLLTDESS